MWRGRPRPRKLQRLERRLAIPRRVYTQSHIDYVVEVILEVWKKRDQIHGMKLTYEAPFLRHFTAKLEPEPAEVAAALRR